MGRRNSVRKHIAIESKFQNSQELFKLPCSGWSLSRCGPSTDFGENLENIHRNNSHKLLFHRDKFHESDLVIDLEQNFAAGLLNLRSRSKDHISVTLSACYIRHVL